MKVKWWDGSSWGPSLTDWSALGGPFIGEPTVASYRGGPPGFAHKLRGTMHIGASTLPTLETSRLRLRWMTEEDAVLYGLLRPEWRPGPSSPSPSSP